MFGIAEPDGSALATRCAGPAIGASRLPFERANVAEILPVAASFP
jgi:hypothetical protein